MHELALTQSILAIVSEEADKHGATKVLSITLKVGVLSGVIPQLIQEYFDLVSGDTVAAGAKLLVEQVAATVHCPACGQDSPISRASFRCPLCGSTDIQLLSGREFYIDSLEAE